jgi:hypothetical protein
MPSEPTTTRALRGPLLLTATVLLAFVVAQPTPAQAAGGAKREHTTRKMKREKALLNMVEQPSFPNEDLERKALVVAPKIKRTRGRKGAPTPPRAQTLSATGEVVTAANVAPAVEPQPTAPQVAAAAPVAPAVPKETPPKPKVTAETASRIDSIIDRAFVEPPPEAPAVHAAAPSAQLAPDKIAAAMKPVSTAVKKACPFGERGVVMLRFEVGAGGRIDKVTPEGPLAARPQTACVVDAAMKAKLDGASQTSFRYPFPVK